MEREGSEDSIQAQNSVPARFVEVVRLSEAAKMAVSSINRPPGVAIIGRRWNISRKLTFWQRKILSEPLVSSIDCNSTVVLTLKRLLCPFLMFVDRKGSAGGRAPSIVDTADIFRIE